MPTPTSAPPPPWRCRLRAVVRLGVRGGRLTVLAVVAYADTPVGPYGEALLADVRLPLDVTVPWIVVDSAASAVGGRQHWGLPKAETRVDLDLQGDHPRAVVLTPPDDLRLRARAVGPRLPVAGAAVLAQPGRGRAPLRLSGRARPAWVRVDGGPSPGAGPGAVLDAVLHLAASRGMSGSTA